MASCPPMYFNGISREIFDSISQQLATQGFPLSGSQGTVHGPFGIVIGYNWNETSQTLVIEVVEKSFFVTCNQIKDRLSSALGKYA